MPKSIVRVASAAARPVSVFFFMVVGIALGLGLKWSDQPVAVAQTGTTSCENAVCVPAGDAAQWRNGNLILNTSGDFANGLIVANGNVGIATVSPAARLHVANGSAIVEGKLFVGSNPSAADIASASALNVNGTASVSKVAVSDQVCIKGACISDWNDLKTVLNIKEGSDSTGDKTKAGTKGCFLFYSGAGSAGDSCMSGASAGSQMQKTCCPQGTITSCTIESRSPGGDNLSISGTGCDLPAPAPKAGSLSSAKLIKSDTYVTTIQLSLQNSTTYPAGTQCYKHSDDGLNNSWAVAKGSMDCTKNGPAAKSNPSCTTTCCSLADIYGQYCN